MTTSGDRIDRIETLLEQFIAASVADRQESNERMNRLEQSMVASDERMTRLEETIERQNQENNERLKAMDEKTDARFNQLVAEADANREITFAMLEQMMTLQEETKQILEYLFGQQKGNCHGDTPQP